MLMETERIYTEASISKSMVNDQWETDANGNPIIIIEASNENLDYQEEQVMKSALLDSQEYFLKNGVISYDHKHIPSPDNHNWDPEWNAEKYIMGKPLEVWEGIGESGKAAIFVKAVLSKSNAIAKEIIGKLKDKIETIKASVGGRRVKKALKFDPKTYKEIPQIISVDWDEVALTPKPVNQTLGPVVLSAKEFVKSLTAGGSANPLDMGTGGNTLQMQSVEKELVNALIHKIRNKEIKKSKDAINHLVNSGVPEGRAGDILKMLVNKYLGDVIMADEKDAIEEIDTSTDELLKALKDLEDGGDLSKSDGKYVRKNGHMYKMMADGKYEAEDKDAPPYEDKEDEDEKTKKSLADAKAIEAAEAAKIVGEDLEEGVYDASQDVLDLKKSVGVIQEQNTELRSMIKSLIEENGKQNIVLKSLGAVTIEDSKLIKSIADTPQGRVTKVTNLKAFERFEKSQTDKLAKVDQARLTKALDDLKVGGEKEAIINHAFRRGGIAQVAVVAPEVVEALVKE